MKDADKIIEEVEALNAECARLREEFKACAVRLADAVVRNRHENGNIEGMFGATLRAYIEADARYTEAVDEALATCDKLKKCVLKSR